MVLLWSFQLYASLCSGLFKLITGTFNTIFVGGEKLDSEKHTNRRCCLILHYMLRQLLLYGDSKFVLIFKVN